MKVLVVEDNLLNLKLFVDTLTMKGYEVISARNGIEALEILKNIIPDVIILDLYMPGMSGFRLGNTLSKDPKYQNIPIIVVSASSSVYDVKEMASYNVKAYLVKPVSPTKLLETVKKVIIEKEQKTPPSYATTTQKTYESPKTETEENKKPISPQAREVETGIRVAVEDLLEGMVLGEPITKNKTIIYKEGTKLDAKMIEKIKALGIREAFITKKSFEEFKDIIELRSLEEHNIEDVFKDSEETFKNEE